MARPSHVPDTAPQFDALFREQLSRLLAWREERLQAARFPRWQFDEHAQVLAGLDPCAGFLHAEYRQSLTKLFGGPIHVRLDLDRTQRSPRLFVRFQQIHQCVLPDAGPAGGAGERRTFKAFSAPRAAVNRREFSLRSSSTTISRMRGVALRVPPKMVAKTEKNTIGTMNESTRAARSRFSLAKCVRTTARIIRAAPCL